MLKLKKSVAAFGLACAVVSAMLVLSPQASAQDRRSAWTKYRTPITIAGGTLAGAGIGGLAGGRKGAVIGAIAGAGGSSIFELVRHKRNNNKRADTYRSSRNRCRH